MQLTQDLNQSAYTIRSYHPGSVCINDETYTQSLILTPTQIITDWPPKTISELHKPHLEMLLISMPTLVIIGCDKNPHAISQKCLAFFLEKHIGIEVMHAKAACKTYNILMSESRRAVLGLILAA